MVRAWWLILLLTLLSSVTVHAEAPSLHVPLRALGDGLPPPGLRVGRTAMIAGHDRAFALRLCEPRTPGCYRDTDGYWRNPNDEWALSLRGREPNYLRAVGWSVAGLGLGIAWYWIERENNALDWDLDSWSERFGGDAYRYDANKFPINWLWHPLSGAAFYGMARTSNLSVLASTATSTLASFAWEFLLEFKERVSINDTLATPLAGISLGEYLFRLGRYLGSAPGGGGRRHKALRWTLGLPVALNDAWDGDPQRPADEPSTDAGWGTEIHGDFVVGLMAAVNRANGETFMQYGGFLRSRLTAIPGFLREGDTRFVFTDANITTLNYRVDGGTGRGGDLETEAVLAGIHLSRIHASAKGLRGGAWTVGTSVNWLYRRLDYADFQDLMGSVGLPGLVLEGHWLLGPAVLTLGARAHAEFASPSSQAAQEWQAQHPKVQTKTVLDNGGYYYSWGGAGRFLLEAKLPWLRAGSSLLVGAYRSRNGLDRQQETLDVDFRLRDTQLRSETWLGFVVPRVPIYLGLSGLALVRGSQVPGIHTRQRLYRCTFDVGIAR